MTGPVATVGNGAECTLQIDDGFVSRVHVEIAIEGSRFRVRDLGSKNGTFIGANRVTEVVVPEGTRVALGHTKLCLLAALRYDQPAPSPHERFGQLVGRSVPMREVFAVLERSRRPDVDRRCSARPAPARTCSRASVHAASRARERPVRRVRLRRGAGGARRERAVRSRARRVHRRGRRSRRARSSAPTAARCSSTRSASCRSSCSRSCCARSRPREIRRVGSDAHREGRRARDRRRPTAISTPRSPRPFPQDLYLPARRR